VFKYHINQGGLSLTFYMHVIYYSLDRPILETAKFFGYAYSYYSYFILHLSIVGFYYRNILCARASECQVQAIVPIH
jgi:hypothetical protein